MNRKTVLITALLVSLGLFAYSVMSLEEPDYTVVEKTDAFELRQYQPYVVAETVVDGDFEAAGSRAFRILVDYIQRGNQGGRNLPMTAPVNQQPAGDGEPRADLLRAAPASPESSPTTGPWLFQFVMPKEYSLSMLPPPLDDRVKLRQEPARLVAARRYSGGWSERKYRDNERALLAALEEAGLTPTGVPIFARYNAPFVPGFLRRNEVLVPVQRD